VNLIVSSLSHLMICYSEAHFTVNFWSDKPFDLEELTNAKEITVKVQDLSFSVLN
jgi:hypothetical protein